MNSKYDIQSYGAKEARSFDQLSNRCKGDDLMMRGLNHTVAILKENAWSMPRVCQESAKGMKYALRLAAVLLVMIMGVQSAWGQTLKLGEPVSGLYNSSLTAAGTDVVVLNDLEDHNWAYYSDENCPVHRLNPADIKITYYGNGQTNNNVSDGTEGTGAPTNFVSKATGVQVNVGESANTFVYYKTLERANVDGSGDLSYTTIPNPFQVRPTYGTASASTTRSVYISWSCNTWYYSQYAQVYFTYTNASGTTVTSSTYTSNGNTTITAKVGTTITLYARGSRNRTSATYNPTVTAEYDDNNGGTIVTCQSSGTSYTNNSGSVQEEIDNSIMRGFYAWRIKSLSEGLSIDGKSVGGIVFAEEEITFITTKAKGNEVEFEALWAQAYVNSSTYVSNSGSYRNAYERNFKVGTTITTYTYPVTFTTLNPSASSGSPSSVSYSGNYTCSNDVKFENMNLSVSGYIDGDSFNLTIGRGVANGNNNVATSVYGDYSPSGIHSLFTLRVESGKYTESFVFRASSATGNTGAFTANVILGSDYDRANNKDNSKLTFTSVVEVAQRVYCTSTNSKVNMLILSGTFGSNAADKEVYMGLESPGNGHASQTVRTLEVLGGNFLGGISGGIETAGGGVDAAKIIMTMRVKGGTIHRYLYGSGQYSAGYGSRRIVITGGTFDSWVAGGCYGTEGSGGATDGNINLYFGGNATQDNSDGIFGAGYGSAATSNNSYTVNASNVVFADEATTTSSVYGGGNNGYAKNKIQVYVAGGTVGGNVFGGANKARSEGDVNVTVTKGTVNGGVYGGSNVSGDITGKITVDIYGTDPAPSANAYALGAVFGGGNHAAYNGKPEVKVHNCDNSIEYVYGGGNAATVTGTDVTIYGGNTIGNVFGGCYGANVTSSGTNVKIYGGTIGKIFGGNNQSGSITGSITVTINKQGDTDTKGSSDPCPMRIGEVYSGGNVAGSSAGTINIGCTGDLVTGGNGHAAHPENIGTTLEGIGYVYGGANQANISSDITVNINSGMVANVFGGNNTSGAISGGITVNIQKDASATCAENWYVGNVFGAGNLAQYNIPSGKALAVSILNGTISGNVYGGGKGLDSDHTKGQVTGNPVVTIGDATKLNDDNVRAVVSGDVYGGGDAGNVVGTPQVNVINKCNTTIGNVYGGGNAADVNGTDVNIDGGTIGMVFGGGHGDKNANPQKQADVNGGVAVDVTGGTITQVFGGSNSKGTISGSVAVNIEKGANSCEMHITEVYGGGNEAAGNAGTLTIGCTGDYENNGEGITNVYGGANAADVGNSINLTIKGGHIDNVYGGNNTSGSISGSVTVNVNWDDVLTCDKYLGNVFGGGNLASLDGAATVNIQKGTVSHNVYGGGNQAGVGSATVSMTGGSVLEGLYGGCNTSGTVTGNIAVTITAGTIGSTTTKANAHGGGYGSATATNGNVEVNIGTATTSGGTTTYSGTAIIYGDVYGGSALGNVNSDTNDYTHVNLNSGTIHGDAYGGGLGDATHAALVNGNVTVTQNGVGFVKATTTDDEGNTVVTAGRIFGCNNLNGSPQGTVLVLVNKTGATTPTTGTYQMNAVYGGGNLAAYDPAAATLTATGQYTTNHTATNKPLQVVINGCDDASIEYVYGGGNAAATPATDVVVLGAFELGNVFGGGNGKDRYTLDGGTTWRENPGADVGIIDQTAYAADNSTGAYGTGESTVTITGGTIHNAFGGSNTLGNIRTSATVNLDEGGSCPLSINEVYGGGNEAYMAGSGNIVLGCITYLKEIYGGAKDADVGNDVSLTITSGHFDRVFGGNNMGGDINGSITVNIEETGCHPITIGELYGCGNQAAYATPSGKAHPTINIKSFTSIGRVFGGGYGSGAIVTGNPTVNINEIKGAHAADAYAGETKTIDGVSVTLPAHAANSIGAIGTVFGGGNAAEVRGNTTVNIGTAATVSYVSGSDHTAKDVVGASITGNVYGGGNQANVTGNTSVTIGKAVNP